MTPYDINSCQRLWFPWAFISKPLPPSPAKAKVRKNTLSFIQGEVTGMTRDSASLIMLIIMIGAAFKHCLLARLAPTGPFTRRTKWHPSWWREHTSVWLDKSKRCPLLWAETGYRNSSLTCCLEQVFLSSAQIE